MKKSTQARLADWALTCGVSSTVLPFLALLILGGVGSVSWFWLKCAGLIVLGSAALWMLGRFKKEAFDYPVLCWLTSLAYFIALSSAVAGAFPSTGLVLILAAPEIVGAIVSLIGLGHQVRVRMKSVQP